MIQSWWILIALLIIYEGDFKFEVRKKMIHRMKNTEGQVLQITFCKSSVNCKV